MPTSPIEILKSDFQKIRNANGYECAQTMRPEFYTSPELLKLEEGLFRREWICLGRAEEVSNPGDYFTTSLLDEELLVCRNRENEIVVLSNVCRHRGSLVATGSGNKRRFSCPYHAWTYTNDGALVGAPHMGEVSGFSMADCRLPRFSSETWQGFIYVNLDGTAPPLSQRLAKLESTIAGYEIQNKTLCYNAEEIWPVNWKLLAENFMEGYHLSTVHRDSIHQYTPTALCEYYSGGPGYTGYYANFPRDKPLRGKCAPALGEADRYRTTMFSVLPAHVVAAAGHLTTYLCLQPHGVDQVKAKIGLIGYDVQSADQAEIDKAVDLFVRTMAEDKVQLEKVSRGLRSRYFQRSALAPIDFEGTTWDLYRYLSENLADDG
jgi:phenylpropionate dioxygenase-like ring-hydroxylating dioxygenase large terminal subunit